MNTTARKRAQLAASLLGVAVVIPLLTPGASASPSDGRFQVAAVNSENASITATVGSLGSTGSNPDPGTGNPGTGNPGTGDPGTGNPGEQPADAVVASYSCGPLSFDITQEMIDFSKPNEELYKAGRASEMVAHPDGWKMIASGNLTDGMAPGIVDNPVVMKLGSDIDAMTGVVNYRTLAPESCYVEDGRISPRLNTTYVYESKKVNGVIYNAEGKWLNEEGALSKVIVTESVSGTFVVNREGASDRLPLYMNTGDNMILRIQPIQKVDGVELVTISLKPGGSIGYSFQTNSFDDAPRKNGPISIQINSSGKITNLVYINSLGNATGAPVVGATNAEIVANYNAETKQNWDGNFPKLEDLDLTVPFLPQSP